MILKGLEVCLESAKGRLEEYCVEHGEDSRVVSCYVPSDPGQVRLFAYASAQTEAIAGADGLLAPLVATAVAIRAAFRELHEGGI
jgi:hypothetical protein